MSAVIIDKDNLKFFKDMMNEDALKVFESETCLAIGNVTDGKTDGVIMGELLPSGCFQLEWLYVAQAARRRGVASDLIDTLRDALSKTSASCICFNLLRNPDNEVLLDFLMSRGFELESVVTGIATLTLSDLSLLLEEESPDAEEFTPFSKVPSFIIREFFSDDKKENFAANLYATLAEGAFVRESCVLVKNEKIESVILATKADDEISIVALEGDNTDRILKHFLVQSMPVYGRNCSVTLACNTDIGERALRIAGEQEDCYEMVVGKEYIYAIK